MSSSHRSALSAHNNNNRPVLICKADYGTNSSIINKYLHDKWNIEWRSTRHYRQTKIWFPEIDLYKSKQLLNLDRLDLGYTIQFLTGHGWWKQHLVTANLDNNPLCQKCGLSNETPEHLVKLCPELTEQRLAIFHTELISDLLPQWTVAQLSRFLIEINIAELIAVPVEEQNCID